MTGLLFAALERLSPRVRRLVVVVGALAALGAVIAALTLSVPRSVHERRPTSPRRVAVRAPDASPRRLAPPVSTAALLRARRVAERFLAGYLMFAYGRGSALAVMGVTSTLRLELLRERAELTPAERRRRPRVVSLQTLGTTPLFVVAAALIDDGGVATYRLRFTLQRGAGRWAVSSVEEG
ncbi:MAG: hypothetical protein ACLP01_17190 [Solirubrobacteraceae bacterium]